MNSKHIKNKIGETYGRLTVLSFDHVNDRRQAVWLCECSCGNKTFVEGTKLASERVRSCGCLKRETLSLNGKARIGSKNPNWGKRKRSLTNRGYIRIRSQDHPRCSSQGYVLEHILVMEQMLGRPVPDGAVIHHCNGDKTDNRPFNLRLFGSNHDHLVFHAESKKMHMRG